MAALRYTMDQARLKELAQRTDLVVVDLDKCLFPGYSQTVLGALILWRLLRDPLQPSDRKHAWGLLHGGLYVAVTKVRRPSNRRLLEAYGKVMRGVPEQYFHEEVRRLPRFCRRGVREVLQVLSRQATVGIASLGVDIVAEEFLRQLPGLSFCRCNMLDFDEAARRPLLGYREPVMCDGSAKAAFLEGLLGDAGAACPLVIGHDADDVPMAAAARTAGGWSIGIRPSWRLRAQFDVWVDGADWTPLLSLWGRSAPEYWSTGVLE